MNDGYLKNRTAAAPCVSLVDEKGRIKTLQELTREIVVLSVEMMGSKTAAAEGLDLNRNTVARWCQGQD